MSISVPDGTPEELMETAEAVSGYVTAAGGTVLRLSNESPWGRRRLAYPIRHNSADLRDGFYTLYHFQIKPQGIEDIERELRLNERIIRHLMLVLDSEPIFIEEQEDIETIVNPETGEITLLEDAVTITENIATGEAEIVVDTETIVTDAEGNIEEIEEDTEVILVDAQGEIEGIAEDTEVIVIDADGEVVAIIEDTEVVVVDADGEIAEIIEDAEIVVVDADGEIVEVIEDTEVVVETADGDIAEIIEDTEVVAAEEK